MGRQRSPNRDKAFEIYKEHKGNIQLREIARLLDAPEKTISGWKVKDKWDKKLNGVLPKNKRSTPNKKVNKRSIDREPIAEEVRSVLENTELTDKQRLFCIYYTKCFNATKAYQKAYGCSYDVANAEGYKLLVNPCVKAEIQRLKQHKLNRAMLSEDDLFQKYIDIAFADITDYVEFGQEEVPVMGPFGPIILKDEETGEKREITKVINTVKFKESSEVDGSIIAEVKQGRDGASIKLQDKMKALQWLSDRMDLLPTETRLKIDNEKAKVQIARERLELEKKKSEGSDDGKPIEVIIKRKGED